MKKILFLLILITSCKGYNSSIVEKRQSLKEICPNCVLTWSTGKNNSGMWIAQDTSKTPNEIFEVTFCYGIFKPVYTIEYMTKIN